MRMENRHAEESICVGFPWSQREEDKIGTWFRGYALCNFLCYMAFDYL